MFELSKAFSSNEICTFQTTVDLTNSLQLPEELELIRDRTPIAERQIESFEGRY